MCIVALPAIAAAGASAAGTAGLISASTAAYLSLGATALGAVTSAMGSIQQGKAQAAQYKYQAAVDRNNKIISDRQYQDAIKRGEAAEEDVRRKTAQIISKQRTGFASNNIDLGSDVVFDTLSDSSMFGELDALTVRSNAAREAYGYQVQGMNYQASANNSLMAAKNAKSAAKTSAFSSVLSGASTLASNYADFSKSGAIGSSSSGYTKLKNGETINWY